MAVRISRREVLNNIVRFKDNLNDRPGRWAASEEERSYPVLLNKKTGDLQFAQRMETIGTHLPKKKKTAAADWQEMQIDVSVKDGAVHFALRDSAHRIVKPEGFEPLAYRVIKETLDALNRIAHHHRSIESEGLPEKEVLRDLSDVDLVPPSARIDDLPGWLGSVSRLDAEKMLRNSSNGTYLLRCGGEDADAIAFHLSEENRLEVRAYICTVVESHEKISDILLLDTERGWTVYLDNPDLNFEGYHFVSSAQGILHEIHHRARHPLS